MKATIWTKPRCNYCYMAKLLFDQHNIEYEEIELTDETREEFKRVAPHATTVPQILIDNVLIGGYTDLMVKLRGDNA